MQHTDRRTFLTRVAALTALVPLAGVGEAHASWTTSSTLPLRQRDALFLREEEKLARDVYLTLYDTWGLPVFANIAGSEQHHMDAAGDLVAAYGLPDPVASDAVGAFTNDALADLYDQLVAYGLRSEVHALRVGASIEDMDLMDIADMASRNPHPQAQQIFASLMCGSRNHLRAFHGQLEMRGARWRARFLEPDTLDDILAGTDTFCASTGGSH